jgi:hypothetical protein
METPIVVVSSFDVILSILSSLRQNKTKHGMEGETNQRVVFYYYVDFIDDAQIVIRQGYFRHSPA